MSSVKNKFQKHAQAAVIAISSVLGLSACASAPKPELLGKVALPAGTEPQSCADYKTLSLKGPEAQRLVKSGAYAAAAGALGKGLEQYDIAKDGTTELLAGAAGVADLYMADRALNKITGIASAQCDADLTAISNGALCVANTNQSESGRVENGTLGTTQGSGTQTVRCTSVGANARPRGLSQ